MIEPGAIPLPSEDDKLAGWQALTQDAGPIHLSGFGILKIEGRDSASWLQKLVTANVEAMTDGAGVYALLLEAKGHVLADFVLLRQPDSFLLYTSRAAFDSLVPNLRRAIFREQVTLTDLSQQFTIMSLQGPQAYAVMQRAFDLNPNSLSSQSLTFQVFTIMHANQELIAVHHARASTDGFDFLAPDEAVHSLWFQLVTHSARSLVVPEALNVARVEAGIPWYGADFDETTLAPEARLDRFIAENKGCYPGQEVIARIRNLGHVNRLLCQIQIDGDTVPSRGDVVFVGGAEGGMITSSVWSYKRDAPLALGYIRKEWEKDGTRLQIANGSERLNARVLQEAS